MLIIFKSATNADLIMLEKSGKEMLAALGKNPEEDRGILTVEQLPVAIAGLKAAVAIDEARPSDPVSAAPESETAVDPESAVSLSQRAVPLIEMLERSLQDNEPVTWGV